jgi:anti-sigma regulatory factor (Ser/Thr protein kinase)
MTESNWIVMSITRDADVLVTRAKAAVFAAEMGFEERACAEIAIVVSELATNVVKYAGRGSVTLAEYEDSGTSGIEILAEDNGPGILNPRAAIVDGYSEGRQLSADDLPQSRRGMGTGLGAVHRLMDHVQLENRPEGGLRCAARKLLDRTTRSRQCGASALSGEANHV